MIAINQKIVEDLLIGPDITSLIDEKKQNVKNFLVSPSKQDGRKSVIIALSAAQKSYLKQLIKEFDEIVKADFTQLEHYQKEFNRIITPKQMLGKVHQEFRHELIKRMGYPELRNHFYPRHFENVGIKVCVYCNSQLALTVRKVDKAKCAKFQVDHYYAKSEYPCFSISFHNLYPVCGPCNNSKSAKPLRFRLYSNEYADFSSSRFSFSLDKKSLLKYRVNGIQSALEIRFDDKTGDTAFNELFAIEGIYETQKDIAEELVLKSMIYNKTYSDSLRISLRKLYGEKNPFLERLLLGNYLDEKDIHKRPMAKFTQDIAKQLGLI